MGVLTIRTNEPMIFVIHEELAVRTDTLFQGTEYAGVLLVSDLKDAPGLLLPHV